MKPKFVTALDAGILGRVVASARGCYSLLYPLTPECGRGGRGGGAGGRRTLTGPAMATCMACSYEGRWPGLAHGFDHNLDSACRRR